ncbi:spermidine synthase [Erythrobacter sp.]|uniref:spermidine synthase n=1 Tax=Erythrobacter sp. TaxID=1042 RepID=UPI0026000B4A|nr:fused MFS/spermidine synthase [Erythrobacter sp.]
MTSSRRSLFVAAILVGSFLLFLVQPLVARLALPRLGGTPNVWNSAMLVYQALLLGGYAYAHVIGRFTLRRQLVLHIGLLTVAALSLPLALADLPDFGPGLEVFWVPALLFASVGPVFFLISAQAPLIQRWYSADPAAGDPYPLYAASNLGSFAGLISYPILIEPLLPLGQQSLIWSLGYGALIVLLLFVVRARWQTIAQDGDDKSVQAAAAADRDPIDWRRMGMWLVLSAVPSGLMLSTTTHLTTDIFAMPLLWVIPLGLYLLSFSVAFAERRTLARLITGAAPVVVLLAGGMAMVSQSSEGLWLLLASVALLFVVAVALHTRLYDLRPDPSRLTLFYLVMSAGGALGGLFTALIAPLLFDWVWEHPLLMLAAAALIPLGWFGSWQMRITDDRTRRLALLGGGLILALGMSSALFNATMRDADMLVIALYLALAAAALVLAFNRVAFVAVFCGMMVASSLAGHGYTYVNGDRVRSYFGVYNISDNAALGIRVLGHGTTNHGQQFLKPEQRREPTAYYGRAAGIGLLLSGASDLFGEGADIGVVGLGTGTLACYREPDQKYRFYEIDPVMLDFSTEGRFTFLSDCAPDSETVIGDARIALEQEAGGQYDVLVVDAFSSDAIPLHLLTREALQTYRRSIRDDGAIAIHITNRFIDLKPVLAALARDGGLAAAVRRDVPDAATGLFPSTWVVLTPTNETLASIKRISGADNWRILDDPAPSVWTDQHASTLSRFRWNELVRRNP